MNRAELRRQWREARKFLPLELSFQEWLEFKEDMARESIESFEQKDES